MTLSARPTLLGHPAAELAIWLALAAGAGAAAVPTRAAAAAAGPESASAPQENAAAPISESAWWWERVQTLTHDIARGQSERGETDRLYPQLSKVLEERSEQLGEVLRWARSLNERLDSLLCSRIFLEPK